MKKKEAWRRAVEAHAALLANAPERLDHLLDLLQGRASLGARLAREPKEKLATLANRKALGELTRLAVSRLENCAKDWPTVPTYHEILCRRRNQLGLLSAGEGNWAEAEKQYRLGLDVALKLEADFAKSPGVGGYSGPLFDNLACLYIKSPKHRDPAKALACAQEAVKRNPNEPAFQCTLADAC